MLREKLPAINIGIGVGVVLQGAGNYLRLHPHILGYKDTGIAVPWVILAVGLAIYLYGCMNYAWAKGQSGWFGLIGMLNIIPLMARGRLEWHYSLNLLSLVGLLVLLMLYDNHPQGRNITKPDEAAADNHRLDV